MDGAAVMADVVRPVRAVQNVPTLNLPYSLLPSYNISLNFSSIFSMLPTSRFLTRWKFGNTNAANIGPLVDGTELPSISVVIDDWSTMADSSTFAAAGMVTPQPQTLPPGVEQLNVFPGPWGFFTSWYMLGLLLMGILLHRMQNLVIPSRLAPPSRRARHAYRFGPTFASPLHYTMIWRRIHSAILPLNFSRTTTRLLLHLPSLYLLSKMLFVWSILVLQTSEFFPSFLDENQAMWYGALGWIHGVGKWVASKEMEEICWETFVAVCAAFLVEGFVKALDGIGSGFMGNVNPNTSPFNLVGYAFLLHVYSSPTAHSFKASTDSPSRPDKHVIITIAIPLLQLTILHMLSISKRLSTHRLFPTTLTSFLSLMHFHGTLFSHFLSKPSVPIPLSTPHASSIPSPVTSSSTPFTTSTSTPVTLTPSHPYLRHSSISYPLLNYIPNIFETILICIILLTISLNALVQLLVRGRVDRLFSGLGVGPGTVLTDDDESPGFLESLPLEEDFGVLLLRVGVASLEATGLRGWGNEVAPINLASGRSRARNVPNSRRRIGGNTPDGQMQRISVFNGSNSGVEAGTRGGQGISTETTYGTVRMGRLGVGEVHYGSSLTVDFNSASSSFIRRRGSRYRTPTPVPLAPPSSNSRREPASQPLPRSLRHARSRVQAQVKVSRGLNNEVRTVDLGVSDLDLPRSSHRWNWVRELWKFMCAIGGVVKGLVVFLVERAKGRVRVREYVGGVGAEKEGSDREDESGSMDDEDAPLTAEIGAEFKEEYRRRMEREVYQKFLRGEEISDDDDSEVEGGDNDYVEEDFEEEGDEEDDEELTGTGEEEEEDGEAEAVSLFKDLLRNIRDASPFASSSTTIDHNTLPSGGSNGEMVLAHLAGGASGSPLTRRRWNALVNKSNRNNNEDEDGYYGEADWEMPVGIGGSRRAIFESNYDLQQQQHPVENAQSVCVICTVEARDIICWPCRCLAMCDNCREALASKSAPSKHRCPCCRQSVEGYSRIYIP